MDGRGVGEDKEEGDQEAPELVTNRGFYREGRRTRVPL